MANRRIAVIVGVDEPGIGSTAAPLRYAGRDAEAIAEALCDPRSGTFAPEDVAVFTGPRVRAADVKSTLRRLVRESHETDHLLFYFAGHALTPQWEYGPERYLVTPDLDESCLADDPEAGLRMSFLTGDVFEHFKGTSVLILDCCLTGGRAGFGLRESSGQAVLAARSSDGYSREDPGSRHGVFTRLVLRGLDGEAADDGGVVTFARLSTFVQQQNLDPPQVIALPGKATILLTRPAARLLQPEPDQARPIGATPPRSLANPLDEHVDDLTRMVDRLARWAQATTTADGGGTRVEFVRSVLNSGPVAYVGRTDSTPGGAANYVAMDRTDDFRTEQVWPVLWACDIETDTSPDRKAFGYSYGFGPHTLWCVPVGRDHQQAQFLVVIDPPAWLTNLGQVGARVLQTMWRTDFAGAPAESEVRVITALREVFGRMPEPLFRRALDLYGEVLADLRIVFQPIVTIGQSPKQVAIHSYEALARRAVTEQTAPLALLQLAHVWGDHFVVERDRIILSKALATYAMAHSRCTWNQEIPKPVSVNVSVRSLLDDSYIDTLRQLIRQLELPPHVITLEISEQDAIEPWSGEQWAGDPHTYFNQRLARIAGDLEVSFALDDFGTGHASLDRMSGLPITHIKVDRAILGHGMAFDTLKLIVAIAREAVDRGAAHTPRPVIVEGVDAECPITLHDIHASGVRHIQGFITGQRGGPDLLHLSRRVREDIASRVRGDGEGPAGAVSRGA